MRITAFQRTRICSESQRCFGSHTRVWLFGSRVDDRKKGGDIDLYVEPEIQDPAKLVDARLHFMLKMHHALGDQKIDLVLHRSESICDLPVHRIAKETGERLL